MPIDVESLQAASLLLSDVVAEPERWHDLLERITRAAGAMGATLIPYTGAGGVISTQSMKAALDAYVKEKWYEGNRDLRKRAIDRVQRGEVVIDQDMATLTEIRNSPLYNDLLPRFGAYWWAGLGFQSGNDVWCLALHRSPRDGQFDKREKQVLQEFLLRLKEIGRLSDIVGRVALSEIANSFDRIQQAAIIIDDIGRVIRANETAEKLFDNQVRVAERHLVFHDKNAAAEYVRFLERLPRLNEGKALRAAPIVVRRGNAPPLLIEMLSIDGAVRSPFLNARALLLLNEIRRPSLPDWQLVSRIFDLTPSEARLAARLATGDSLEEIAEATQITKETARTTLKAVFQKADVHRQTELVAKLASLLRSI